MKALLIEQEVHGAIDSDGLIEKATEVDKKNIEKRAFASILLNPSDKILRELSKEIATKKIFSKFYSLYLAKILSGKVYLKHHFYSFNMDSFKDLEHNLNDFKKNGY